MYCNSFTACNSVSNVFSLFSKFTKAVSKVVDSPIYCIDVFILLILNLISSNLRTISLSLSSNFLLVINSLSNLFSKKYVKS